MTTFVLREYTDHILVSLQTLIDRLPIGDISIWSFIDTRFASSGAPFGYPLLEFERMTWNAPFMVSDLEFKKFLSTDFQMTDGLIEARRGMNVLFCIECVDSTQWEIVSSDPNFIAQMLEAGFAVLEEDGGSDRPDHCGRGL